MRISELEGRTLQLMDRLIAGQPIEDDRIELKRDWPDPVKAARILAGHANASLGEPILWLIGLDESSRSVVGAEYVELSNWSTKLHSCFDGLAPQMQSANIPTSDGKTIVALLFDTNRSPYVVNNPTGGQIQREVPWRDGTGTRTARREDILKMLLPQYATPTIEPLGAIFEKDDPQSGRIETGNLQAAFLVVPQNDRPVVVFTNGAPARLVLPIGVPGTEQEVSLSQVTYLQKDRYDIACNKNEWIVKGPGIVEFQYSFTLPQNPVPRGWYIAPVVLQVELIPFGASVPIHIELILEPATYPADSSRVFWRTGNFIFRDRTEWIRAAVRAAMP
jgi:hypothetical protein